MFTKDGSRVGFNDSSLVRPASDGLAPQAKNFTWYAGSRDLVDCATANCKAMRRRGCHFAPGNRGTRDLVSCPVEFGAIALSDIADVVKHSSHGAVGMLIVEPEKTCADYPADQRQPDGTPNGTLTAEEVARFKRSGYCADDAAALQTQYLRGRATADIRLATSTSPLFRDFAVIYQDDLSLHRTAGHPNISETDDYEDTGQKRSTTAPSRSGRASAWRPQRTVPRRCATSNCRRF